MNNIISLTEYRRRKGMTVDEKLREMAEYYDKEIDTLHANQHEIKTDLASLALQLGALKEALRRHKDEG